MGTRVAVQLVSRLALAAVMLVVAAAITSLWRSSASFLVAPVDVVARTCADVERPALVPERTPHREVYLEAVESDLEDRDGPSDTADGAPLILLDDAAPVLRPAPEPCKPARALRSAARSVRSRFTVGTGIPRGPPV